MKTEKRILTAFILNLSFAVFEFVGGIMCQSYAVASDAIHDMGDAVSIGISCFLERKSGRAPDEKYTLGYGRFSILGSFITLMILIFGSIGVTVGAVKRIIDPVEVNSEGMTAFAVIGLAVNLAAVLFTRDGDGVSLNLRTVNLHMLEDVLGWAVVLIGSAVIRLTGFTVIDPLLSLVLSVFILHHASEHFFETLTVFLGKTPSSLNVGEMKRRISVTDGVIAVSDVKIVSPDGNRIYAALRIVIDGEAEEVKKSVRCVIREFGICESTIEVERHITLGE